MAHARRAHRFALRFPESQVAHWAQRYPTSAAEEELLSGPVARARARGHLEKPEFLAIARWKTPRSQQRCASNDPGYVEEVTRLALGKTTSPRLAIESLTLLSGVLWPTASVILHFCHRDLYPILDVRALWSVRCPVPAHEYDHRLWEEYTAFIRGLCARVKQEVRTVDRALWQYSREHQHA